MRLFWGFCFIFFINKLSFSQESFFENIGTKNGLPSTEVYHTFQDSKGFIWITTDAGICRFDGKNMQTFTSKDGLPENVVFDVYEDSHGRMWFNCMSGSLFYYQNKKIYSIAANEELKRLCSNSFSNSFFIGENDTIFSTVTGLPGVIKISPDNNYKNIILQNYSNQYYNYIIPNRIKKTEFIYTGSAFTKLKKDLKNNLYSFYSSKAYEFESAGTSRGSIFKDLQENVYYTISNYLFKFSPDGKVFEFKLPTAIIFVQMDLEKNLWVGTKNGVLIYKKGDLNSKPQRYLEGTSVSSMLVDREGTIWLSTLQKGVYIIPCKDIYDISFQNTYLCAINNESNNLTIVYTNSNHTVSLDSSLSVIKIETNNFLIDSTNELTSYFKKGDFTFYSSVDGLYCKYKNQTDNIKIANLLGHRAIIFSKKIISIGNDSFAVMCPTKLLLFHKKQYYKIITLPFIANSVTQLKNKTLLLGSRNNSGLHKVNNDQVVPYGEEFPELKTRINCIKEDINGNLWIATNEKGVFFISGHNLTQYSSENGLVSDKVNTLDIDKKNNIWIGTNMGISKISANGKVYNFNKSHGLPSLEIEQLSIFNNNIFCGSREHVFYFNIDNLKYNTIAPNIYLTSVQINSKPFTGNKDSLLKHNKNNIEFNFTSTTYKSLWEQEFEYKLNGYDKEWKHTKSGQIQYTNLPAGKYQFQVFALNNDRLKSLKPAIFSFSIDKPYWLKWWFILFETAALFLLLFLFVRWRINKIRKNEKEKTELNKKMSEFQMTAIRAQMNPHFIFNAITSIQHYILKSDVYQSYNYLAKFAKLIRNILDSSKEEFISIADEINALNLYIELEKIRFKEPFDSKIEVMDELDIDSILIPTMIMQPYVENAIWHGLMAKRDSSGKLLITFKEKNDMLEIVIEDNGIGINESAKIGRTKHVSRGLELTKMRLQGLSENNKKQSTVEIIDLSTTPYHMSGTRITINIPIILN